MAQQDGYRTSDSATKVSSEFYVKIVTTLDDLRRLFDNRCPACNRDTLSLRNGVNCFYCGAAQVIFNWEIDPKNLRVHDPLTGQTYAVPGKGLISPNEWHAVTWDIESSGMSLFVDGQLRFQNRKDYRTLNANVGIGPSGSKVTVDYFVVQVK